MTLNLRQLAETAETSALDDLMLKMATYGQVMFEAQWIGVDDPIPEGWRLANNEGRIRDHHSHYARMIVREVPHDDEGRTNPASDR